MRDWITGETETITKPATLDFNSTEKISLLQNEIERVIKGKSETVKLALAWEMSDARRRKLMWDNAVRLYARAGL